MNMNENLSKYSIEEIEAAQKRQKKKGGSFMENLEAIAEQFNGVQKAYAIQAGRELRILVNNEKIPDNEVKELAARLQSRLRPM